jgi:hypothetical protein
MAATAAILDLVSVDYLTNACADWSNFFIGGVINLHHIPLLPKPYLPTHRQTSHSGGICHALRSPCLLQLAHYVSSHSHQCCPDCLTSTCPLHQFTLPSMYMSRLFTSTCPLHQFTLPSMFMSRLFDFNLYTASVHTPLNVYVQTF